MLASYLSMWKDSELKFDLTIPPDWEWAPSDNDQARGGNDTESESGSGDGSGAEQLNQHQHGDKTSNLRHRHRRIGLALLTRDTSGGTFNFLYFFYAHISPLPNLICTPL